MHPLLLELKQDFEQAADPSQAAAMSTYMRELFPFYGVMKPERSALSKAVYKKLINAKIDPVEVAHWCWEQPQREWQYVGMEFLEKGRKIVDANGFLAHCEQWITQKSWWDTVDFLASHTVGDYLAENPELRDLWIADWRNSDNFWKVRTCLLFQLRYGVRTDQHLLFSLCAQHAHWEEFFIRKAIGWALRQYAYSNPNAVIEFVEETPLSNLSKREALKNL